MTYLEPATLNPGIRRLVMMLRAEGFDTCDSGDGRTHEHACDRDHAYVSMRAPDAASLIHQTWRLVRVMSATGVTLYQVGDGPDGKGACIQASFDPVNGVPMIDLMNVTDEMLP